MPSVKSNAFKGWMLPFAVAAAMVGEPAWADAFVQQKGQARVIVTTVLTDSAKGFDDNGDVASINKYKLRQVYVNAEYGVTDNLTVIAAPSFRHVHIDNADQTTGFGYSELGARLQLARGSHWAVSTQALVRIAGHGNTGNVAQLGNTGTDFDARLAAAYFDSRVFVSAEAGYRVRSGDLPNETHIDGSAGVHLSPKFMVLASSANTISDGAGRGVFNRPYRYGDGFLSLVYSVNKNISFQAGYTATLYGRNALRQRGLTFGVWYNF
ncbi:hypothetical protein F1640_16355 [Novosphingobium sp. NBM11]|uniref:hypothetical protein n=1 Tax=Novosphingobium sp. NBM11 TaxID=2596914 RepID=UPI0018926D29|nr:hypothetical protein [Novosphingobium sp. NBM11]MBF5091548.1 hypothetical protein [Novosphingobium sp. NBM11]